MNLTRLEYFLAAAKCLNFTKAAKQVYITQPSLSKQIALLEDEIGVKLFNRTNRKLELTDAGSYLLSESERLFASLDRVVEHTQKIGKQKQGLLSIGFIESLNIGETAEHLLKDFSEELPEAELNINRCGFDSLLEKITEGAIDLAITLSFQLKRLKGYNYIELEKRKSDIAMSNSHPLASKQQLCSEDLENETIFLLDEVVELNLHHDIIKKCKSMGFNPRLKSVPNNETILSYLDLNMGIALYDKSIGVNRPGRLKFFHTPLENNFTLVCVWAKNNPNRMIDKFLEFLPDTSLINYS
ncbi:MAG: LysR family transcriptional regulator [Spirochaetales bacterium]|nr:LysR family transcriptional regulator [Spirochaetales bacterium]